MLNSHVFEFLLHLNLDLVRLLLHLPHLFSDQLDVFLICGGVSHPNISLPLTNLSRHERSSHGSWLLGDHLLQVSHLLGHFLFVLLPMLLSDLESVELLTERSQDLTHHSSVIIVHLLSHNIRRMLSNCGRCLVLSSLFSILHLTKCGLEELSLFIEKVKRHLPVPHTIAHLVSHFSQEAIELRLTHVGELGIVVLNRVNRSL